MSRMSEVDYQMALLLQYRFEQEHKKTESTDSDRQLALELQQQFQTEVEVERPSNNLVYKAAPAQNSSKCLVDPSWEVIDPTPDIHVLFMAFNQRFFWNQLGSVTVAWSKRMTTCAGICAYQGRGGMCSITLSEPLLKLRPRKDLVETLLHEMIHAYLFVTNNNTDRDGHGPEFHKHMYRINAEAGTNISVYHDFHDEVRLYQQHWWRCDGPCQSRKPFFGMVRRATNRAPGPYDRWWAEHSRNCGGTFIKVKSPEPKPASKKPNKKAEKTTKPPDTKNDIRNFLPTKNKGSLSSPSQSNKENTAVFNNNTPSANSTIPKISSLPKNNVHTISNNSGSGQISNVIPSKTSNIFGFDNFNGKPKVPSKSIPKKSNGVPGPVKNVDTGRTLGGTKNVHSISNNSSSGQISNVIPSKTSNIFGFDNLNGKPKMPSTSTPKKSNSSSSIKNVDTGRTLGGGMVSSSSSNTDYSKVRDHWLKKFENSNNGSKDSKTGSKRSNSTPLPPLPQKIPRLSNSQQPRTDTADSVNCPVCDKLFNMEELNSHLDTCLEESQTRKTKKCFICDVEVLNPEYDDHVRQCSEKQFGDVSDDDIVFVESVQCKNCLRSFGPECYAKHAKLCNDHNEEVDLTELNSVEGNKNCPVCKESLAISDYDIHVQQCILKMCDEFDQKYEKNQDVSTSCLACNKKILKSELDAHLEDCMSISNVFETSTVFVEDDDNVVDVENQVSEKDQNESYNCPFCMGLVLENDMQNHLDGCLKIEDIKSDKDKSLLIESLCSNESDIE